MKTERSEGISKDLKLSGQIEQKLKFQKFISQMASHLDKNYRIEIIVA